MTNRCRSRSAADEGAADRIIEAKGLKQISDTGALEALPSVAMFFAMQKHFVAGLTFGATKG